MIGIGSCDGGNGKKTVSKSSTGRSSSNGLEGILVSLSSNLAILSCLELWEQVSPTLQILRAPVLSHSYKVSFLLSRSRQIV